MEATAKSIWRVPAYLPYVQPTLTDRAIAAAEQEIGFSLPHEYLDLLRVQNGGYIRFSLPEMDMVHDMIKGIGPDVNWLMDTQWKDYQESLSFPLDGLVPFDDGNGHNYVCLDYRHDPAHPSVTYVDTEGDRQTKIAASFSEYLSRLRINVEDEYVMEGVTDIEHVKFQLSVLLNASFDQPDASSRGYATERALWGDEQNREGVWFSPNSVPRGFVRPSHLRYRELKDLMPGTALRYPELSKESYLLSMTDGVRSRVLTACAEANLTVRPLREVIN